MNTNNYIKPEDRKTILFIGDDFRAHSGIGVMSRSIIYQTANHFNWIQIGVSTTNKGLQKPMNMSDVVNKEMGYEDSSVILYQDGTYNNQYSCMNNLRYVLKNHHVDAILFFTDPRYYLWVFENEKEIRQSVPLIYYNIWDNLPYPLWNTPYYKSCDGLFAISKQTLNINIQLLAEDIDKKIVRYIPHGVAGKPNTLNNYYPIDSNSEALMNYKQKLFGSNIPSFVLLFNARNLSRKNISNLIFAWKTFTESLPNEVAKKCVLILHCNPVDYSGTDLLACYMDNCDTAQTRLLFINENLSFDEMNLLYNISDGVVLPSYAEGWGLSITEAMMTGKMFIATVTGGMQDQMRFEDEEGKWIEFSKDFPTNSVGRYKKCGSWCIPIFPVAVSNVGSPLTPYIYEDVIRIEDICSAIKKLYDLGSEERQKRGQEGWTWANSEEAGFNAETMGERMIEGIDAVIKNFDNTQDKSAIKIVKNNDNLINKNIVWKQWESQKKK